MAAAQEAGLQAGTAPVPRCVFEARALVGECPRWHAQHQALYWVDIYAPALHRHDPASGANVSWPLPERIGCFAFRREGGLIAGMQSGIYLVDFDAGRPGTPVTTRLVHAFDPDNPESRFNDGRCDPGGHSGPAPCWTEAQREKRGAGSAAGRRPNQTVELLLVLTNKFAAPGSGVFWLARQPMAGRRGLHS